MPFFPDMPLIDKQQNNDILYYIEMILIPMMSCKNNTKIEYLNDTSMTVLRKKNKKFLNEVQSYIWTRHLFGVFRVSIIIVENKKSQCNWALHFLNR